MSDSQAIAAGSDQDYAAIEQAVMETARGRWFMAEFARRNRHADTTMLLGALRRLEEAVSGERTEEQIERIRFDLQEMARSIAGLKRELDATHPEGTEQSRFGEATEALDAIVKTTEQATTSILAAAESVQEVAWQMREAGIDAAHCEQLDRRATDIYTACAFQDLTAQRTQKVVRTLRFLEGRINSMIDRWGGPDAELRPQASPAPEPGIADPAPLHGPDGEGLSQEDVDVMIVAHDADELTPFDAPSELPSTIEASIQRLGPSLLPPQLSETREVVLDDLADDDIGFGDEDDPAETAEAGPAWSARPDEDEAPAERRVGPAGGGPLAEIDQMPTTARILLFS